MHELYYHHPWLINVVILVVGALVASSSALLGTFLVLRRMALVSDAISHAILPGIAVGFILTHSLNPFVMLVGAAVAGLVTVWLVETLYRSRRVHEDTAIAVVFPALFALGVVLIDQFRQVHLDLDCVLFGEIGLSHYDILNPDGVDASAIAGAPAWQLAVYTLLNLKPFWMLGIVTLLNLVFVLLFYKELKLSTFDPGLAQALGFSPQRLHYLLMSAVSITTVAAFESVGAILVVAFLIVPAAAAYLLTDRLSLMLVLAVGLGILSSFSGFAIARGDMLDCSISGAMAAMTGVLFLVAWLVAPRYGLLATLWRRYRLRKRFEEELALIQLKKTPTV